MANRKKKTAKQQEENLYRNEIILIITLVVSLLFILSNFNLCGVFGKGVNFLLFGLFGLAAYLVPFLLFFGVAFGISNKGVISAKIKMISSGGLYIVLTGILQLITYRYSAEDKIIDFFKNSAEQKNGGGLVGGLLTKGMCFLFGEFGTYVILIGLIVILIMLITEKFLFAGLKKYRANRKKRKEEEYLEPFIEEEGEEPRRSAKVVTFSRERRGTKKKSMEEIESKKIPSPAEEPPSDMENLSIFRGYEKSGNTKKQDTPIYEEELKQKFNSVPKESKEVVEKAVEEVVEEVIEEAVTEVVTEPKLIVKEPEEPIKIQREKKKKEIESIPEEEISVGEEIGQALQQKRNDYKFPSIDLLIIPKGKGKGTPDSELRDTAAKLKTTLESFGVRVEMKNVSCGPTVTRYELQPAQGVKVSKITSLTDDIKLSLAAADIRIEAPIPGKSVVGIEVPNKENTIVVLRSLLESSDFKNHKSSIAFAVGKDIGGNTIVTDIGKMPHLLIAGATGSGKSVCINTLIMSILYKANPDDVKLIMVDPKVVELSVYNGIPHLLIPVVTDPKKASGALNWAVVEMTERYKKFADLGVRDIKGYNARVKAVEEDNDENFQKMPQIVIIVDELADLMMVAPGEVEDAICRLAQLARAAGIHLIIATQRPSVNVITGLIKANVPSRIAFAVSSAIDSRTILDGGGAEKLLGNGDMLFFPSGYPKPIRVQGSYVSDKEVGNVVDFLKSQYGQAEYSEEINNKITASTISDSGQKNPNERDEYFTEAGKFIIDKDKASIGMLQRVYKIGYNRAARIMDQLYDAGVVGPEEGTKPRKVIMTMEEFMEYVEEVV